MTQSFSKNQIINAGLREGKGIDWIQNQLRRYGYTTEYNPALYIENYKQLPSNVVRGAKEFARDLRTFGGMMLKPAMDISQDVELAKPGNKMNALKKSFKDAINNDQYRRMYGGMVTGAMVGSAIPKVGALGGAMAGAMIGNSSPQEVVNAILSTYNTSTKDFGKRPAKEIITRATQGVFDNPIYSAMDLAPLYAKPLGRVASKVANKLPTPIRQIFPDERTRQVNRALTNSLAASGNKYSNRAQSYLRLGNMPNLNREEILKNIISNTGKLTKEEKQFAKEIKLDLKANEQEAIRLGLIQPEVARANTIAQYVMANLKDNRILHKDIVDRLIIGDYVNRDIYGLINSDNKLKTKIDNLIQKGSKLYNEDNIAYFTQALAPSVDPMGKVIARDIARIGEGYFGTNRIIGNQDIKTLAKVFDDSFRYQMDQVAKFSSMDDAIRNITNDFSLGTINKNNKKIIKADNDLIAVSPTKFKELIKNSLSENKNISPSDILNQSVSYDKGSIILDKLHLDMIDNAFSTNRHGILGKLLNIFKKVALGTPHWIMLNRIGNASNNMLGGVKLTDYRDALRNKELIPDRLKNQTSFNSYIKFDDELGRYTPLSNMINQPLNKFKRGVDRFDVSEKKLQDYGKLVSNTLSSITDVTATPFFKMESLAELTDRYANFISKAKKMAIEEGRDWKDILKEANTNDKLYNKINDLVNKDLGDYIGKNYALPNKVYDVLGSLVPFYRFISQTARTTANQLINNPLSYSLATTIPSRFTNPKSEEIIKKYNLDREKYKGGLPYKIADNGNIRTFGFEPLPIGAVLSDMADVVSLQEPTTLLSPFVTGVDALRFQNFGRMATSPRRTKEGKDYQPNTKEIAQYILNTVGKDLIHPYKASTTFLPELMAGVSGKGLYSRYDTNPFTENLTTYQRTMPIELIGKQLGIQSFSNYPQRIKTKNEIKKDIRRQNKVLSKIQSKRSK